MRKLISSLRNYFIAILLALVTACSSVILLVEGGISGTGISFGSIAAFASVIVNGTKLEIGSQTEIFIDGQPANENDLNVGYVIRVDADFDNRIARRIDYIETVRGPLTASPGINPDTLVGSFDLLGQSILINSATIFDGIDDVETLVSGDVLDVSGVRDSNGAIIARYVQLKSPSVTEYRLVGVIADITAATFTIGNLLIDYTGADISNLNGGVVENNGIEVRVKGLALNFNPATPSLVAEKISDSVLILGVQNGDSVELEGVVTGFVSIFDMDVNGLPVDASSAVIEDGDIDDIVLNALVEIEGTVDISNVLKASKVIILPLNNIRIRAAVDSVDTVSNTITVLGVTFQLNERTQLEDNRSTPPPVAQFSLLDLSGGDWVRLRGYTKIDGSYILSRLVRRDGPDPAADIRVRLQAPVDVNGVDKDNKTIILLGITVSTDYPMNTDCENDDDNPMDCGVFFNTVMDGDIIKAVWLNFTSTIPPADELSLE